MKIYLVKSTSKEKIKLANTKQQQQQQQDQANKQMKKKKHPLKWWGDHFSCIVRPYLTVITNRTELFRSTIIYQNHYDRLQIFPFFFHFIWMGERKKNENYFFFAFIPEMCVHTLCLWSIYGTLDPKHRK